MSRSNTNSALQLMSDTKFFLDYSQWREDESRYETWSDSCSRSFGMHRKKYAEKMSPQLEALMAEAEEAYKEQLFLGSQRSLQFGGEPILKHNIKIYNCAASYADRPQFFAEAFYILLGGCGTGFSVQKHHVKKLPSILPIEEGDVESKRVVHTIVDSIEGWADAYAALLSSYFDRGSKYPEYKGKYVEFDYSLVRLEGSFISGGFKAPGPEPLRKAIEQARALIENALITNLRIAGEQGVKLRPIQVYDLVMFASDAVLAGGVRRAATLCMFSNDDEEMMTAKSEDNWAIKHPWRQRSNNSAVYLRKDLTLDEWDALKERIRKYGEPGIILVDSYEQLFNPCVEIGLYGYNIPYEEFLKIMTPENEFSNSGWQMCNLVELNGGKSVTKETFWKQCRVGAITGTLQAGYTDFKYLSPASQAITEREALLGVGLTGWMQNTEVLFDKDTLAQGVAIIKAINEEVAGLIGINTAARLCTVKPAGNSSTLLQTFSGIHGGHDKRYFRSIEVNSNSEIAKAFQKTNPRMCKRSNKSSNGKDFTITFPIEFEGEGLYNKDLLGINLLKKVAFVQEHWVRAGTVKERCVQPYLCHNVSNTVTVDDWDVVGDYIYRHRDSFCGLSFMSITGDKVYEDAPFLAVPYPEEIAAKYGTAGYFASGLVVDALHVFPDGLWKAINYAKHWFKHYESKRIQQMNQLVESTLDESVAEYVTELDDLLWEFNETDIDPFFNNKQRVDWKRRFVKFADNYFKGDLEKCGECLLDVNNLHRWEKMVREMNYTDLSEYLTKPVYKDVNTQGSAACVGNVCSLDF